MVLPCLRESEGSPDVLQAISGGLLHVLVLRPDQLEQVGDHLVGKIRCLKRVVTGDVYPRLVHGDTVPWVF